MANHITRLILDNSAFDPELGKSIKLVNMMYANIDALCKGMVGLDGPQRQMIANLGKLQYNAESASVMVGKLDKMFQDLKQTYSGMDIHTKMSAWGKSTSSMMLEFSRQIKAIQAQIAAIPDVTTKKVYIQPVTSVSGGSSTASAAASAASAGDALSSIGGKKGAFSAILGGNLAARAVMDSLRMLKKVTEDAIKTNMDFEYSNATLSAVLGKSKQEIMDLTMQAQKLGATTLYTAKEISELQIELARLGFNQDEIKQSTASVSELALATGVSLNEAAKLTGSTLRAFGYDASQASRVASVLGVSTTKSALDMQKLATAMGYASSVSRQAGFEIEEVVAMLGKMVDNGQQATTAGVNVRNIMLDLSNKSSKLSKAIKQVTGKDQIRGFDEFIDALRQMRDAGINLDDVANVVQKRVTPGFLNMIANTEGIAQLRDELKGCTGELHEMANKMENTLRGEVTLFTSAWDGLMLSFQNSNGTIKETVSLFTSLINKITRLRNLQQGGDIALNTLAASETEMDKMFDAKIKSYGNKTNEQILVDAERERLQKKGYYTTAKSLYDQYDKLNQNYKGGDSYMYGLKMGELDKQVKELFGLDNFEQLREKVVKLKDDMDILDRVIERVKPVDPNAVSNTSESIAGNEGIGFGKDETKSALSGYEERIAKAYDSYAVSLNNAAIEVENGSMTEKEYLEKKLSATQQLYRAYVMVISEIERELEKNPALKGELTPLLDQLKPQLAGYVNEMSELSTATGILVDAAKQAAEDAKAQAAQKKLNTTILKGLRRYANVTGKGSDYYGIGDQSNIVAQINAGEAIDWTKAVQALNNDLADQNIQIKVNLDNGSIDRIHYTLSEALSDFSGKVGAFSTIINSFDNIKQSAEGLIDTLNSDADAWDKMFATINFGIGILDTVVGVMQAIETLNKVSIALKEADALASTKSAVAAGVNANAKIVEAGATKADATANMIDATAKSLNAHAMIPFVGIALGAAAAALILATIAKAQHVGHFAKGGIVPGNSPTGDKLIANVNSGEGILTAQGVRNLGALYAGQGYGAMNQNVRFEIEGTKLIGVTNNTIRAKGGKNSNLIYQH